MKLSVFVLLLMSIWCIGVNGQTNTKSLTDLKRTDCVPTLEHTFSKDKNTIYCSSFLYCWHNMPTQVKTSFLIDSSTNDLFLINNSTSHINTLKPGEYTATSSVKGSSLILESQFTKSLPFEHELEPGTTDLVFDGTGVSSFGTYGSPSELVEILYYKDDENFIVKLIPANKEHEIIAGMTGEHYSSLSDIVSDLASKRKTGMLERTQESMKWRYALTFYDVLDIPVLTFDIETHFPSLEGKEIKSTKRYFRIDRAEQKVAFNLNSKGAYLDTSAEQQIFFSEPAINPEITPKKMIFNKPFFVMLKRTDNNNPYFALWVANTELMRH